MSADRNPIDQFFQQRLGQAKAPPPADLWAKIEAQLPAQAQRKPLAFWWLAGLGISLLAGGFVADFVRNPAGAENVLVHEKKPSESLSQKAAKGENPIANSTKEESAVEPITPTDAMEISTLKPSANVSGKSIISIKPAKAAKAAMTGASAIHHNKFYRKETPGQEQSTGRIKTSPSARTTSWTKPPEVADQPDAKQSDGTAKSTPDSPSDWPVSIDDDLSTVLSRRWPLSPLATIDHQFTEAVLPLTLAQKQPSIRCPLGERRPRTWVVEAHASVDWPVSNFGGGANSIASRLNEMSTPLTGYSAGLRLGREIGGGFWIYGGFQYSTLRQRFTSVVENERRQVQIITIRSIVRAPGDTLRVSDTSMVWQIGRVTNRSINVQQMIDLPLLFSYQTRGEGLQFALTAGPVMNFRTWYNGLQVDVGNNVVPLKTATLRRSLGLGAIAMVQVVYPLPHGWSIWGGPHMRYNFRDYTLEQAGYRARNHQVGLQMGLRYQLNNR